MPAKRKNFPYRVKSGSVTVTIYQNRKKTGHTAYLVTYHQGGKRQQESLSNFADAEKRAKDIAEDLASGVIVASQLKSEDKVALVRASEALRDAGIEQAVDTAVVEYVAAREILQNRASLAEVCRDWMNRHAVRIPKISVMDAKEERIAQARADGKYERSVAQQDSVLNQFAEAMNCHVTELTPATVSAYLSAMKLKERTRRNHRDMLANFFAWCVTRGYLPKGTDLLEGVQNYSKRKTGEIQIYSPEERRVFETMTSEAV